MANSFFKNGDKAYSENLNDGILVGNAFDWTVNIGLPTDTGDVFPSSSDVVKAKVADVSATPNSNLSIGSTISNSSNSSQVYRLTVYPNFNRFGGFKSITLTADSGVTFYIANKGGSTPIVNNLDYSDLGNVPELKVLKEYDIVVTIPKNKGVTGLSFVFQSSGADVSGSIDQENVSGLNTRLNNIESKNTQQDGRLTIIEGIGANVRNYQIRCSQNVNIGGYANVIVTVKDQTDIGVAGETVNLLLDGVSVGTETTDAYGTASWNVKMNDWGLHTFSVKDDNLQVLVDGWKQIGGQSSDTWSVYRNKYFAKLILNGWTADVTTSWKDFGSYASNVKPTNAFGFTSYEGAVLLYINNAGQIKFKSNTGSSQNDKAIYAQVEWAICDDDI